MYKILKSKLTDVSFLLKIVAFLNVIDSLSTYYGLKTGLFFEPNHGLNSLYNYSEILYLFVSVVLSTLVLIFLSNVLNKDNKIIGLNKWVNALLLIGVVIYGFLLLCHIALFLISFIYFSL